MTSFTSKIKVLGWSVLAWLGLVPVWPWSGLGLVLVLVWLWSGPGLALVWPWSGPGLALGLELGRHNKQIPMRPTIRCASCTLCDYAGPGWGHMRI